MPEHETSPHCKNDRDIFSWTVLTWKYLSPTGWFQQQKFSLIFTEMFCFQQKCNSKFYVILLGYILNTFV